MKLLQVHAWHWDNVSETRKTTLACLVFELSALDLVPYSKPCPDCPQKRLIGNFRMFQCRSKHPDETLRMCRVMYIRTFCACSKTLFRFTRPICKETRKHLGNNVRKCTFRQVRPGKIQINLRIRAVWPEPHRVHFGSQECKVTLCGERKL